MGRLGLPDPLEETSHATAEAIATTRRGPVPSSFLQEMPDPRDEDVDLDLDPDDDVDGDHDDWWGASEVPSVRVATTSAGGGEDADAGTGSGAATWRREPAPAPAPEPEHEMTKMMRSSTGSLPPTMTNNSTSTGTRSFPTTAPTNTAGAPSSGKTVHDLGNGARLTVFRNGTRKETRTDGRQVVWFVNGDVRKVERDREEYYYAEVETWHTTWKGGTEVYHFHTGQIEAHHPGGTKEVIFADGSVRIVDATGYEREVSRALLCREIRMERPEPRLMP